jgi:hypothetical protein
MLTFLLLGPLLGPGLFSVCQSSTRPVGVLGRGISLSQRFCLHTGRHKQNKRHISSGIRIDGPNIRNDKDSSYLRQRYHSERLKI